MCHWRTIHIAGNGQPNQEAVAVFKLFHNRLEIVHCYLRSIPIPHENAPQWIRIDAKSSKCYQVKKCGYIAMFMEISRKKDY